MIKKVQSTPDEYTNCHLWFADLCSRADCYQHAMPIVDHPILKFKTGQPTPYELFKNEADAQTKEGEEAGEGAKKEAAGKGDKKGKEDSKSK